MLQETIEKNLQQVSFLRFLEGKSANLGKNGICGFSPLNFKMPYFNCASELRCKTWQVFVTKVENHLVRIKRKSERVKLKQLVHLA